MKKNIQGLEITQKNDFLMLPLTAQGLYFHLCMNAKANGKVDNAETIARMCGAEQNDIFALISGGLIEMSGNGYKLLHVKEDKADEFKEQRQRIIDYLNKETDSHFRDSDSNARFINARLREGYTVDDFIDVIDAKVDDWGEDAKMSQYLRPKTLFATNFEAYLQAAQHRRPKFADFYRGTDAEVY